MKHFRMLAAGLCSAVLLCGFAIPAYAYSDSGNEEPPVVEETPAPEPAPTITPGEGFSEDGNLVTRDLLYDAATNKQFITVETSGGNTFYIVIDYDKPVDEDGEQYHTYFLNMVMKPICWRHWRPLAESFRPAPAQKNVRPEPSIRIARSARLT